MESHGRESQFTKQQLQQKNTCQSKLTLDSLRPFLKQDLVITNRTELSKHVWCFKEGGLRFKITRKI